MKPNVFKKKIFLICEELLSNVKMWSIWFVIAMSIPNLLLCLTEGIGLFGCITNILFPLAVYTILLSIPKRPGVVILSLFIFILMNMFQNTILYLYGESIIAVDMIMNLFTTNTSEANELLSNLIIPIVGDVIIYAPFIIWAVYSLLRNMRLKNEDRRHFKKTGFWLLVICVFFATLSHLVDRSYSIRRDLYPVNVVCNIFTALNRAYETTHYHETSASFLYQASSSRPKEEREIYVLMIGETSRACNWQIMGYERETNPKLSERTELLVYPIAFSQSNTTHKAVPLMLTPLTPMNFDSINHRKSIISAFKEAGYYTSFFSNQSPNRSYNQFFAEEADTVIYLSKESHYDMRLADLLKQQVADTSKTKQFIILHAYGSHFNYKDRYPEEYNYFTPSKASQANKYHRADLLNAYDNSIRYTDDVLNTIIKTLENLNVKSGLIYTSDHGEDIFDDERNRFLHSSPVPTYYQLHVPLLIWLSDSIKVKYPLMFQTLSDNSKQYVAPTQTIFHTLLDIAGIMTDWKDPSESLASETYTSPQPLYLNDLNEAVKLENSGIKNSDFIHFGKYGVLK